MPEGGLLRSRRWRQIHSAIIDLTQFELGRFFDLNGVCAADRDILKTTIRRVPLLFVDDFSTSGATEGIADRHLGGGG